MLDSKMLSRYFALGSSSIYTSLSVYLSTKKSYLWKTIGILGTSHRYGLENRWYKLLRYSYQPVYCVALHQRIELCLCLVSDKW